MNLSRAINVSPRGVARARRYDIGTALRFRVEGEKEWSEAVMQNISTTGVLLSTVRPLALDTAIEMRFFLPVELNGEFAAEVFCRGSVVRLSNSPAPDGSVSMAARIEHSRFLRQLNRKRSWSDVSGQ
jgi:hypothetical protein